MWRSEPPIWRFREQRKKNRSNHIPGRNNTHTEHTHTKTTFMSQEKSVTMDVATVIAMMMMKRNREEEKNTAPKEVTSTTTTRSQEEDNNNNNNKTFYPVPIAPPNSPTIDTPSQNEKQNEQIDEEGQTHHQKPPASTPTKFLLSADALATHFKDNSPEIASSMSSLRSTNHHENSENDEIPPYQQQHAASAVVLEIETPSSSS